MKASLLFLLVPFFCCTPRQKEKSVVRVGKQRQDAAVQQLASDRAIVDSLHTLVDTSILINGYNITFQDADSVDIPSIYPDAGERLKIAVKHENLYMATKETESYLTTTQGKYFSRSGSTLNLKLSTGKSVSFKNVDKEGDEGIWYNYQNYFQGIDSYLVRAQLYEGDCYILVNRRTGDRENIIGQIYPCPSGNKAIAINEDMEAGYSFNGLQLLEIAKGVTNIEFTIAGGDWAPIASTWINDECLILKTRHWPTNASAGYPVKYFKITFKE